MCSRAQVPAVKSGNEGGICSRVPVPAVKSGNEHVPIFLLPFATINSSVPGADGSQEAPDERESELGICQVRDHPPKLPLNPPTRSRNVYFPYGHPSVSVQHLLPSQLSLEVGTPWVCHSSGMDGRDWDETFPQGH